MATAASVYRFDGPLTELTVRVPLDKELAALAGIRGEFDPAVTWPAIRSEVAGLQIPDERMQFLYDAAVQTLGAAVGRRGRAGAVHVSPVLVSRRLPDAERAAGDRTRRTAAGGRSSVFPSGNCATATSARRKASGIPTARCCGSSTATRSSPANR